VKRYVRVERGTVPVGVAFGRGDDRVGCLDCSSFRPLHPTCSRSSQDPLGETSVELRLEVVTGVHHRRLRIGQPRDVRDVPRKLDENQFRTVDELTQTTGTGHSEPESGVHLPESEPPSDRADQGVSVRADPFLTVVLVDPDGAAGVPQVRECEPDYRVFVCPTGDQPVDARLTAPSRWIRSER
jgi:hypothetical protein